jgi:SAM-dependent methyltransferase
VAPNVVRRELADVARANAWFGGTRAVLAEVARCLDAAADATLTLLDVGTGLGDIPARAARLAERRGVRLRTIGLERVDVLARAAAARLDAAVVADAFALPFADGSVDLVTCSQLLHHFAEPEAVALLRECNRVARRRVIVGDIRRSWLAAAGLWCASFPLGFSSMGRHDGVLSVLSGFTPRELATLAAAVARGPVDACGRAGFRVTCSWMPTGR